MIKTPSGELSFPKDMPPTTVMEVCGTHTFQAAKYALRQLLPPQLELISGPGCPVCVTCGADIALAAAIARLRNVTLYSFGDMLRVPFGDGESLMRLRGSGADVRIALSPMDALRAAISEPEREIVYFAVGFETTAPLTAATLIRAREAGVKNFSVISAHKTMPNALKALLKGNKRTNALLCPGHVAVITGANAFEFVPLELNMAGAISGFEPQEMLFALKTLAALCAQGRKELVNCYERAVSSGGNKAARDIMNEALAPSDAVWRGLGAIAGSGLELREEFKRFDARGKFLSAREAAAIASSSSNTDGGERRGCKCAQILRGEKRPDECPLFKKQCTPDNPLGPCMVSSEGACSAWLKC